MYKSKSTMDRALDAVLGHEIRKLNAHLPKKRQALNQLLKITNPAVEAVDGTAILLKSSELEQLAKIVPEEYHERVRLPIIILRRIELGKAVYTVAGEPIEEFTVKKILGITNATYHQMYIEREPLFLYRPQVIDLIKNFHSLIVLGFGVPKELGDYAPSRD
jgi:uncharacterized protein (UPF0216 family)